MQHIVEVAFDFNDKAITEYIENQLEKDVRDGVTSKAWKEALADAEAELGGKEDGNEQD